MVLAWPPIPEVDDFRERTVQGPGALAGNILLCVTNTLRYEIALANLPITAVETEQDLRNRREQALAALHRLDKN